MLARALQTQCQAQTQRADWLDARCTKAMSLAEGMRSEVMRLRGMLAHFHMQHERLQADKEFCDKENARLRTVLHNLRQQRQQDEDSGEELLISRRPSISPDDDVYQVLHA